MPRLTNTATFVVGRSSFKTDGDFHVNVKEIVFLNGQEIDMQAARLLMDDEICEQIHGTVNSEQEFLDAYIDAHKEKFGEDWTIN